MQQLNRPNILSRIRAAFTPMLLHPAQMQSFRMPDLERWAMPHRSVDMEDWEAALNMAKNLLRPDRTRLMDLYDSILKDAHLGSVMETRVLRVVRGKFMLTDADGKPRPDLLHLLETQWFEDFLQYVTEALFFGHSLIELGELARPGELRQVNRIDPRNVLPYQGIVARRRGEETGYLFREEPLRSYLIEVGRPDDLGLLERVAPVAVVKKYAIGSWSAFVGTYGIPSRWIKTRGNDARRVKQLETVMQNMMSSAYAIIQGDEEFGIAPTPAGDPVKVFDDLVSRMNSEISKRILGQDGTTDNKDASGTYGSLKVLAGVAEDRHAADKASAAYVVNQELLPRLTALGYPFKGIRFAWDAMQDLSPTEIVDAVSKLGLVFDIDPEYIEKRTGIRILGARRMPGELGPEGGNPPGSGRQTGAPEPKPEEETGDDTEEDGAGVTAHWGGEAPTCAICGGGGMAEAAAVPPVPIEAVESLLRSAFDGAAFDAAYFDAIANLYVAELDRTWNPAMLNVGTAAPQHVAHALMESNLYQFSGLKTLAIALDVNAHAKEGGTFATFKRRVDESGLIEKYNVHQLRAEYTNVAMSGIQAGRYYQMQQTADVLPYGEYVTVGDLRVRAAHADLNGKIWPLDHDAWKSIWPPNGWNCRCTVLPTEAGKRGKAADDQWDQAQAELKRSGEWNQMAKGGFQGNRAQSGTIFDLGSYRKDLAKNAGRKRLDKLNVEDSYGRKDMDMDTLIKRPGLPTITPQVADEAGYKPWFITQRDKRSDDKGRAIFNDYRERPWALDLSTLNRHAGKEYNAGRRWEYVHEIPNILRGPDEVWAKKDRGGRTSWQFIKYYQGEAIVVRAEIPKTAELRGGVLEVTSWYKLDARSEHAVRSGTLIKKMPAQTN
jgi:SPP1 gp7 family putative phage head morphogenesis protein